MLPFLLHHLKSNMDTESFMQMTVLKSVEILLHYLAIHSVCLTNQYEKLKASLF